MDSLDNKVALVTGSSRGLGREIALTLAQAGCNIAVNYLNSADEAEKVVAMVQKLGRRAIAVQGDTSNSEAVDRLVATTTQSLGGIDILVNNAGITKVQPLEQITLADWEAILRTNLTSAFLVSQAVLPAMRQKGWGRLIMMSSVAAQLARV